MAKRSTQEIHARWRAMAMTVKAGAEIPAAALKHGVCQKTITNACDLHGVAYRTKVDGQNLALKVLSMLIEGDGTQTEIAKANDVRRQYVQTVLKNARAENIRVHSRYR